jgi:hypothetical protein
MAVQCGPQHERAAAVRLIEAATARTLPEQLRWVAAVSRGLMTAKAGSTPQPALPSSPWSAPQSVRCLVLLTCQETVDHVITSFVGEGHCFTQYALLRDPKRWAHGHSKIVFWGLNHDSWRGVAM